VNTLHVSTAAIGHFLLHVADERDFGSAAVIADLDVVLSGFLTQPPQR
jgi:hypothetical protein